MPCVYVKQAKPSTQIAGGAICFFRADAHNNSAHSRISSFASVLNLAVDDCTEAATRTASKPPAGAVQHLKATRTAEPARRSSFYQRPRLRSPSGFGLVE